MVQWHPRVSPSAGATRVAAKPSDLRLSETMSYVERDGIWHIVARTDDAEAVTVCNLRIVQQTYLWERQPSPLCSRCRVG